MRYAAKTISGDYRAVLGEGPVWDDRTQKLYWVDIERGEVHRCNADGSNRTVFQVGQRIGCIALRRNQPGLIAGLEHSIATITLDPLKINVLAVPEPEHTNVRCNDGKCDPRGRFWVATCDTHQTQALGWLYRIDHRFTATRQLGPFICTNGPAFSSDGRFMYCADSYGRTVYQCALTASGEILTRMAFVRFDNPAVGYPDGLTCDTEGCVWIAHWGGARVSRFSPTGLLLQAVPLPVTQVTSCTFGGPDLQTLFVTSASIGLSPEENANGFAGAVFAVDLDIQGVCAVRFDG
jgi:sugar lactone lactonase YvrE